MLGNTPSYEVGKSYTHRVGKTNLRKAQANLTRQKERLTEAYLAEVVGLDEYKRRRKEVEDRIETLLTQERQLEAQGEQRRELAGMMQSIEEFCQHVALGLSQASFEQKRHLVELLIDRVIVRKEEVEIHYVVPTSSRSEHIRFCHLRTNYAHRKARLMQAGGEGDPIASRCFHHDQDGGRLDAMLLQLLLKALKILSGLRIRFRFAFGLGSWSKRGCSKCPVGNVHAHKELIDRLRSHLLQDRLLPMWVLEHWSFGHHGRQRTSHVMRGQAT
jgi:hypothetical protein